MALQNGSLTMTSEPGVGTRAVIRVPSVERPFASQRTSRPDPAAPSGAAPSGAAPSGAAATPSPA
ncbi:MAG: hypothetical protein ACMVO3_00895 [Thalassobaculum sp.]